MDTLNFLQRVLPTEGFYVTTVINSDGTRQGFFPTVEELAKAVIRLDQTGNNTYFAISSYETKASRKQENVRATKVIALDVDCGPTKPFPTWKQGLIALGEFVAALALPRPMVVHSGNGLHVYWCLTEELGPAQWKPLAEAMKAAVQDKKFYVDMGLTANSALVLRPVGTHNPKNGNEVKLLLDAEPVDHELLISRLTAYMVALPVSQPRQAHTSKLAQALSTQSDLPPANAEVVALKCQQIGWAVKNQGEVSEPLWYNLIGVAAYCQDSEEVAIAWSENHPSYSASETLRKLAHWKTSATGPATCNKFAIDRPDGCKGCKFKDKIGTPARLGVQYTEVAPAPEAPDSTAFEVGIPRPFKRTADGIKMTLDESDIDVCKFDIYPVSYGRDESLGYETVRFRWKRPHVGWQELLLRQALLTDGHREFAGTIADQGIVLNNKNQTGYFQIMLRSYMDELRQKRTMTNLYTSMGWKENFSQFIVGDTILRRETDGSVSTESVDLAATSNRIASDSYGTSGDLTSWVQFTKLLSTADMRAHMFALSVGLSAPLYAFTGLKGLTVSLYGPTGGGKTLAQYWVQSIYGNPDRLHFAAKFTQNTLFGRMGMYCHMPMTIDEVTMMDNKEVGDFAYWVSQGRDKARMNRNAEERDAKTWATPVIVSTNKSLNSKLVASGLDTDAQMARILEVSVPAHKLFSRDSTAGRKIYEFLMVNYGHVGHAFVTKLLELGPDGIRAAIAEATDSFRKRYKADFSGEERYWEQAIVLADLSARLAKQWGLIAFDHKDGIEWVLAQVGAIRRTVAEFKTDSFDLLSEYLNENSAATITAMQTGSNKPVIDFNRIPRGELRVRFDLYRKASAESFSHGTVLLDRAHFRRWLAQRGADYKTFIGELTDESAMSTPKSQKAYLGKDSAIKLGQTYVIGVNLNHPRLQGILSDADQAIEDLGYGQLKSV
jgi:hypothetical protein